MNAECEEKVNNGIDKPRNQKGAIGTPDRYIQLCRIPKAQNEVEINSMTSKDDVDELQSPYSNHQSLCMILVIRIVLKIIPCLDSCCPK